MFEIKSKIDLWDGCLCLRMCIHIQAQYSAARHAEMNIFNCQKISYHCLKSSSTICLLNINAAFSHPGEKDIKGCLNLVIYDDVK